MAGFTDNEWELIRPKPLIMFTKLFIKVIQCIRTRIGQENRVSLAKLINFTIFNDSLKSLKYSKNINGTKFDPQGKLEHTTLEVKNVPSTTTYGLRSVKIVLNQSKSFPLSIICCNFFNIISWLSSLVSLLFLKK